MTKVYAAYTKDTGLLERSSSGGMFVTLAEKILSGGGAVACTVYDYEENKAEFSLVRTEEELMKVSGSKYMQSDTMGIFRKAEEFLRENPGKELMFVGTGCQADGFRRFAEAGGFRERVYIVDLICFGVSSPRFWQDYAGCLAEKYKGKIEKVSFRDKRNGWERSEAFAWIGGKEISLKNYMSLFFRRCILRPSCYECPYTTTERKTDLTIGDYWGIQKEMPDFYNSRGTSLVLIHSGKGESLFDAVKDALYVRESTVEKCLQQALQHPVAYNPRRQDFFRDYKKKGAGHPAKFAVKYYAERPAGGRFAKRAAENGAASCGILRDHDAEDAARRIVGEMSLREKICQMFVVSSEAFFFRQQYSFFSRLIHRAYPVGGICYYAYNLENREQTDRMIGALQEDALRFFGKGMYVCVDEEGGTVARAAQKLGATVFEDMCSYGARGDEKEAYGIGRTLARDLSERGFNVNFAPVADVYTEGKAEFLKKRCFSDDPGTVARMITAEIRGMTEGGILCAPKHFPGHGSATGDSHNGLVRNERSAEEMEKIDLTPFRAVVKAGAPMIMVGHIITPCYDEERPASLSREVIKGVLREKLGYDGIVVCDAIRMKAIRNTYGFGKAVAMAVTAGCDVVLGVLNLPGAVYAVKREIRRGTIAEEDINRSVERIIASKIRYGILDGGFRKRGSCSGCSACEAVCPAGAITMRQDEEGFCYPFVDRERCINCGKCGEICDTKEFLISRL